MTWDDVRKSMPTNLDYFLSNEHVGNMMVVEYFEQIKQVHNGMMMKLNSNTMAKMVCLT